MTYTYSYISSYIPMTVENVSREENEARMDVLDFMDGNCPSNILNDLLSAINRRMNGKSEDYVIAFTPSWSEERTVDRYAGIASFLTEKLSCGVYLDAVSLVRDSDPILQIREYACRQDIIRGKKIILIGSVYLKGRTLDEIGSLLMANGAKEVSGIFIAKVDADKR